MLSAHTVMITDLRCTGAGGHLGMSIGTDSGMRVSTGLRCCAGVPRREDKEIVGRWMPQFECEARTYRLPPDVNRQTPSRGQDSAREERRLFGVAVRAGSLPRFVGRRVDLGRRAPWTGTLPARLLGLSLNAQIEALGRCQASGASPSRQVRSEGEGPPSAGQ